jgi:septal ring factor EnvC (AmiA/AmiB activator)
MMETTSKLLKVFSSVLLVTQFTLANAASATENQQQQLSSITDHIQQIQEKISRDQSRQQDLQQQLKASELQIAQISQQAEIINFQLTAKKTELDKVKKMQQVAMVELTKQQKILMAQIRIIYQLKQSQSLKAVFDPGNVNRSNRYLTYYNRLNAARAGLMEKIKVIVEMLNKNITIINREEQNLQTLLTQKQQQQHQYQAVQQHREQIISALNQKTYSRQQQLTILTANQKSLQSMLSTLVIDDTPVPISEPVAAPTPTPTPAPEPESDRAPTHRSHPIEPIAISEVKDLPTATFKQVAGRLTWPIKGQITPTSSQGVIIKAPAGAPVKAIYAGRVIFASWLRGYGLLVIINHGDGYMSLYARNQAIYRKVGEIVRPGEIVATIGNSGGFSEPSLYFEIRRNGLAVDPHNWCA